MKRMIMTAAVCVALAACSPQSSSVSDSAIASAASGGFQTLTDNTQRIALTVPASFAVLSDAADSGLPDADKVTLFARNDADDVSLYVSRAGALKTTPAQYFAQLSEVVKQQAEHSGVKVGIATENRMNYRFSHPQDGERVNESCMAVIDDKTLYTVCAYSVTQPFDTLDKYLKDVRIVKP